MERTESGLPKTRQFGQLPVWRAVAKIETNNLPNSCFAAGKRFWGAASDGSARVQKKESPAPQAPGKIKQSGARRRRRRGNRKHKMEKRGDIVEKVRRHRRLQTGKHKKMRGWDDCSATGTARHGNIATRATYCPPVKLESCVSLAETPQMAPQARGQRKMGAAGAGRIDSAGAGDFQILAPQAPGGFSGNATECMQYYGVSWSITLSYVCVRISTDACQASASASIETGCKAVLVWGEEVRPVAHHRRQAVRQHAAEGREAREAEQEQEQDQ
eukprot:gene23615-biopygen4344